MATIGSVTGSRAIRLSRRASEIGGMMASAVSLASTLTSGGDVRNSGETLARPRILAWAAALAASQMRMRDSCRNWAVSTRGLATTSTAPASSACMKVSDPS